MLLTLYVMGLTLVVAAGLDAARGKRSWSDWWRSLR
jgi:hypothetical protein